MGWPTRPEFCSIEKCGLPTRRGDLCAKHYYRKCRHGHPLAGRTFEGEPEAFANAAVQYQGKDCLKWPYRTNPQGYAIMHRVKNVCRLICTAAHGPAPTPKHEAAHTCGHGADSCVNPSHLRWATRAENEADKVLHGTSNRGERCSSAKLTREQVLEIRELKGTLFQREIAARFGIHESSVGQIHRRVRWAWLNDDGTEQMPTHLAAPTQPADVGF